MSTSVGREWYERYLRSDHWRRRRATAISRAGHRCYKCGLKEGSSVDVPSMCGLGVRIRLEVHHLNYDHMWAERDEDLEVLCHLCHRHTHGTETDFQRHTMNCADRQRRMNSEEAIMSDVLGEDMYGDASSIGDAMIDFMDDLA